ncbi:MAG: hypothetical protein K8T10_10580 [Candidatus Eremiobacteraeota bacterium]|nr:hypothetical protein [Candidatus Eremiobacteraeota bacterium]
MNFNREKENDTQSAMKKKLAKIISQFSEKREMNVGEIEDGFVLDIPVEYKSIAKHLLPGKEVRHQFVFVTGNRKMSNGKEIYQIFTVCAPEEDTFYRNALFLNANLTFGAFAIADVETISSDLKREVLCLPTGEVRVAQVKKEKCFVLVDTYMVSEADAIQMEASIMTIAKAGDKLEKMLMKEDIR